MNFFWTTVWAFTKQCIEERRSIDKQIGERARTWPDIRITEETKGFVYRVFVL